MKHDDEFGYATKPQSEHDARAHCPPRCELCSADQRRSAAWGCVVLIVGVAAVYVVSTGMFR